VVSGHASSGCGPAIGMSAAKEGTVASILTYINDSNIRNFKNTVPVLMIRTWGNLDDFNFKNKIFWNINGLDSGVLISGIW
jgi:hypothetical protein